ncbi:hypothetical protein NM688_g6504 [Phlebia brevispora]|uniref:Uncharacterized protein n=1 Tax=Phlebia brevispora TaxID=194682 RepID=A0ACC1SFD9_9APHY|nr:hypothetical protein NM688_g6504 [Phlebia brevispora]
MQAEVDPLDASVYAKHLAQPDPFSSAHGAASSGKRRHRPEPLKLVPQNTSHLVSASDARREFLESSFAPAPKLPSSSANPSSATVDSYGNKKSVLKGLFKSKKTSRA